jgi:hypothetical protein
VKLTFHQTEILGKRIYFLVDIQFAGTTVRVSTDALVVPSDDGDLFYAGTAEPFVVNEEIELFQIASTPVSVPIAAWWPIDVVAMVRRGHQLGGCRAEISQWVEGSTYEDRKILLRGRIVDPEYGADGFVNCSIEENIYEDPAEIPLPGWDMREGRVTNLAATQVLGTEDIGVPYPVALGYPGRDPQAVTGRTSGSRCCWISKATNRHFLLVSYGHVGAAQIDAIDQAGAPIWLNHDDFTTGYQFRVLAGYDDAGVPISYVGDSTANTGDVYEGLEHGVPAGDGFTPTPGEVVDVFASWPEGGGIRDENGRVIRKAGDVLRFLLRFANVPVDVGTFAAVAPELRAFNIDCSIDDRCKISEWLTERLLPLLPVSLCSGPAGFFPIVWKPDAGPAQALAHIDADLDPRIEVSEAVEVDTSNIYNDFTLTYGYARRTDDYLYTARLGAEYVAGTNRARCDFIRDDDRIRVEALDRGLDGAGIRVEFTTGAPANVTDGVGLVTLQFDDGVDDTDAIVAALNTSTIVQASEISDSGTNWGFSAIDDTDQTLILADDAVLPHPLCAFSQSQLRDDERRDPGVRPWAEESPLVIDKATAYAVLGWKAAAFALPRRRLTIRVPMHDWGWLRRGNVVTFTYARLGFEAHVALIESLEWGSDGVLGVRLAFIDNPARDAYGA